ncbi:MAG: hypothetical protein LM577_09050 [Thermoproteaceae archaeon]|nr:hypothetical protein [Thermoproteaceae archaeon]
MESRLAWAGAALWALAAVFLWWALPFALAAAVLLWLRPRYCETALALLCAAYLVLTLALAPGVWVRALAAVIALVAVYFVMRWAAARIGRRLALAITLIAAAIALIFALPLAAPLLVLLSLRQA